VDFDNYEVSQYEETDCNQRSGVYFCGVCYHVLIVNRYRIGVEVIRRLLSHNCPSCNNPILKNLNYREVYSPINLEDSLNPDFVFKGEQASEQKAIFQPATVLRGLTSRVQAVDRYIGGLKHGWFSIFYGSRFSNQLAKRYCFRAQLPVHKGGLDATAAFIDAGNSFDPYFLALLARQYHRDPAEVLDRVIISRAFTCYELANLVSELPRLLDTYGARLVVVSDILSLFNEDIRREEAETILSDIRRKIIDLCDSSKAVFIATCCHRNKAFESLLFPYADLLVEFRERNRLPHASLIRHPSNHPTDFQIKRPDRRLTLAAFPLERVLVG
jgi:hypothetical protein